jgi:hypothetical protein
MPSRPHLPSVSGTALLGFGLLIGVCRATDLGSLVANSPFAPVAGAQAAANTTQPLEYRGFYVQESGKPRFNLYDPATQKSTWVEQDETSQPMTIRSYDAANDTVVVDWKGKNLNLTLKKAKVQLQATKPPEAIQQGPGGLNQAQPAGDAGFPAVRGPDGRPDPQRMQAVLDEIRRRRNRRMQGGAGGPVPQPGQTGPGQGFPIPQNTNQPPNTGGPTPR